MSKVNTGRQNPVATKSFANAYNNDNDKKVFNTFFGSKVEEPVKVKVAEPKAIEHKSEPKVAEVKIVQPKIGAVTDDFDLQLAIALQFEEAGADFGVVCDLLGQGFSASDIFEMMGL